MMSNALKQFSLIGSGLLFAISLTGCANQAKVPTTTAVATPTATAKPINCDALKRQLIYNQTNMNVETNDTTDTQRAALNQLIIQNCH